MGFFPSILILFCLLITKSLYLFLFPISGQGLENQRDFKLHEEVDQSGSTGVDGTSEAQDSIKRKEG